MYYIETNDIYKELFEDRPLFDFASYKKDSAFYDATNNKVIEKFKDEATGEPIIEFVGLRPKMYSMLIQHGEEEIEKHRAKGINKTATQQLRHEQYKSQLETPLENYIQHHRIGNRLKKLYTIEVDIQKDILRIKDNSLSMIILPHLTLILFLVLGE